MSSIENKLGQGGYEVVSIFVYMCMQTMHTVDLRSGEFFMCA